MGQHLKDGIALFNRKEFFRAHEEFEAEWHASRGPDRYLHQGLAQACAGLLKVERGEQGGAARLLERSLKNLEQALAEGASIPAEIDLDRLIGDLRAARATLISGAPVVAPPAIRPSIRR